MANWDWAKYAFPEVYYPTVGAEKGYNYLAGKTGMPSAGGIANTLEGDPAGYAKALQGLEGQANQQAEKVKNFLLGREANAQQIYRPMQQMFGNMYGTGGLMPAKAPQAPGGGSPY